MVRGGVYDSLEVRIEFIEFFFVGEKFQCSFGFMLVWCIVIFGDFVKVYGGIMEWFELFGSVDNVVFQVGIQFIIRYEYLRIISGFENMVIQVWNVYF